MSNCNNVPVPKGKETTKAYILAEGREHILTPSILSTDDQICRYRLDIIQEADAPNRNRRKYPWKLLEAGVKSSRIQEMLAAKQLFCEIGHPPEKTMERQTRIERKNSASILIDIGFNRPYLSGIFETMATREGYDLKGLITVNRMKVAKSMRGLGQLTEQGQFLLVKEPFIIINWDDVTYPSVSKAYMTELAESGCEDVNKVIEDARANKQYLEVLIEEDDFAKYIFDSSDDAKNIADSLGLEVTRKDLSINEEGKLCIKSPEGTILVVAESYIQNEINNYLAAI